MSVLGSGTLRAAWAALGSKLGREGPGGSPKLQWCLSSKGTPLRAPLFVYLLTKCGEQRKRGMPAAVSGGWCVGRANEALSVHVYYILKRAIRGPAHTTEQGQGPQAAPKPAFQIKKCRLVSKPHGCTDSGDNSLGDGRNPSKHRGGQQAALQRDSLKCLKGRFHSSGPLI